MRRITGNVGTLVFATVLAMVVTPMSASASPADQGVTSSAIRVGIPYVDLSAVQALGVKLTQGSFPDAYNAIIANLNDHGGINGRKIVPYLLAVNPTGTAPAATACTQLTEDDKIFVAISPLSPDCYLVQHNTPTIQAQFQGTSTPGSAPNFTLSPPPSAYDPAQLAVFAKMGVFKGKKVGVYGVNAERSEMQTVTSALQKLHVKVAQTAINSAPPTDQAAVVQQTGVIAQRFQSEGINEVVAVGQGSAAWPDGLARNQSTYNPPWVATSNTALSGFIAGNAGAGNYVKPVVTSSPTLTGTQVWQDPGIQQCVKIIKKAYPSDTITPYNAATNGSDHSYVSAESACQNMALFTALAKAAGKNLTVKSVTKAGESLKNFTVPASGGPISFSPGKPYAVGPVFVGHYDPGTKSLVFATKSANS
jgi:hypothetical protein